MVVSKAQGRSRHNPERMSLVAHHATLNLIWAVIKSFKHKGLKWFFETGSVSGIDPSHRQKVRLLLTALDTAKTIDDMDLPGFWLHPLKGDKQGIWAIDVNKNWRITFESWLAMQSNYDLWQARQRVDLANVEKLELVA